MDARPWTTIFTKRPRPGEVKTRLSPTFSPEAAAQLAQAMLDDTVAMHTACAAYRTVLAIARPEDAEWVRARYPALAEVAVQRGAELGERMAHWFADHVTASPGASDGPPHVLVGSDCPLLVPSLVQRAHAALAAGADAVFVPDEGGGYALVGLARSVPELFTRVEMSHGNMLQRTCELARDLGLAVEELPVLYDIDRPADAQRLWRELNAAGARAESEWFPAHTVAALAALIPTLS